METLVGVCVDPEIVRFTRVPTPYARSDAEAFLAAAQEGLVRGDSFMFVIADRESDALLGTISLSIHRSGVGEVGYWVRREARGRRVASTGTRLLSVWAIEQLRLSRVELHAFPENVASQRVAARAGFKQEGILRSYREIRGVRRDLVAYSLLPADLAKD